MSVYRTVVTLSHPSLGGQGTNTWHGRTDSIDDAGDVALEGLITAMQQFYQLQLANFATGTTIQSDGVWTQIDSGGDAVHSVPGFVLTSSGGGDPLPPATSLVVGWRTASGGRSGRGRTFLGPMGVSTLQDNGTPTEAARDLALGAAEELIDISSGFADGALGVWSVQDSLLRDFTSATVRNVFGSLRSRRD